MWWALKLLRQVSVTCIFLICPIKRHLESLSKGVTWIELCFPKINVAKSKMHGGLKQG